MVLKSALNSKPIIEFSFYKMLIHTLTVLMVFIFACKKVVRPWPDQPVRLLRLWPANIVNATSLNQFKNLLDEHWTNELFS